MIEVSRSKYTQKQVFGKYSEETRVDLVVVCMSSQEASPAAGGATGHIETHRYALFEAAD